MKKTVSGIIVLLFIGSIVLGRSNYTIPDIDFKTANDDFCYQRVTDTLGNLWLSLSNRMAVGTPFSKNKSFPKDNELTGNLPSDFNVAISKNHQIEYLYAAGLWVGGIKGNDTLVSLAFDHSAPISELNPLPCPDGEMTIGSEWADFETTAIASDTIIWGDTLFRCQVGDCRDWYPLGIEITSHSYEWVTAPYDRITIVEYRIKNIDNAPLEKGWVGIYADCDIGESADDDVSGYFDGALDSNSQWVDMDIAYSVDMNGDPEGDTFDENSPRGIFGVQALGLSKPGYDVNFNWWVDNHETGLKWAPRLRNNPMRELGGSFFIAYGDSNKYHQMSNNEIDYNQIEASLLHAGWQEPDESGSAAAWGNDTRFLISAGPFNLEPMEEVTFSVAYISAETIHYNPYVDIWFEPDNPMAVSDWYDLTDFGQLYEAAFAAKEIYQKGLSYPPPGPPEKFELTDFDDTFASFVWSQKGGADILGYRLYLAEGESDFQIVAELNSRVDTSVTITGLNSEIENRFAIACIDTGGAVGKRSHEIVFFPGGPHAPAELYSCGNNGNPCLYWIGSIDNDVIAYRVYRSKADDTKTILIAEIEDTTFEDLSTIPGTLYEYCVTAVNSQRVESLPSSRISILPLTMTSGILVINQNRGDLFSNLAFRNEFFDSLMERGLEGINYTSCLFDRTDPISMYELSKYSLLIIGAENRSGSLNSDLESMLEGYLSAGGKVILILRHAGVDTTSIAETATIRFESEFLFSRYLMIDSSFIGATNVLPGYALNGDLIGAIPQNSTYPKLNWDSLKVNQFGYAIEHGLPYSGFLWPSDGLDTIYKYESALIDNDAHLMVNGVRYKGESYSFYMLNFPLSLMRIDSAAVLLRTMVEDLNEQHICGDINNDYRVNVGDIVSYIRYLYYDEEPDNIYVSGDIDCDGEYSMADLVTLVNFCFKYGASPICCD